MADRVYPSSKPPQMNGNGASAGVGAPPAMKSQQYRPAYRPRLPPPKQRRSRRGCCCCLCLWLTFLLIAVILAAAIAAGVIWILYRPHRPDFTVSSLRLSTFNVSSSGRLDSRLDLNFTAHNPNRKIVFLYDPISISASATDGALIGSGSVAGFAQPAKNTTVVRGTVSGSGIVVDKGLVTDLKGKASVGLEIVMETKAGVKMGGLKTKRVGIRVTCDGIQAAVPKKGKAAAAAVTAADVKCKVKLRIKIWKWTV
ncbi:hypothetical protein QJS04_geneDACA017966 [Acorus gramineus]|uniref:Late embryogenesis abundant protein LEA-2 subgroup domain-containing protein n=1 Tax=Acorus gramineus TaxID=55184 RepID=A0AAV9A499_ACOGR|nr:hypothetical protein QJS04_geneDACA017966 [Acorus gramineus]